MLLGYDPDWNNIQKLGKLKCVLLNLATKITTKLDQMHTLFCCVLLGYGPDWDNMQTKGKLKIVLLNVATIFTTKLDQMHTVFCCACCWASVLTGTICKD